MEAKETDRLLLLSLCVCSVLPGFYFDTIRWSNCRRGLLLSGLWAINFSLIKVSPIFGYFN